MLTMMSTGIMPTTWRTTYSRTAVTSVDQQVHAAQITRASRKLAISAPV
jgi:hypothetical protein